MLYRVLLGLAIICFAFLIPQTGYTVNALTPTIVGALTKGDPHAPITIVEFTDLQCSYCGSGAVVVDEIMKKYSGKICLILKHCPLEKHLMALPAALYLEAVSHQDYVKAWLFYDRVLREQERLKEGEPFLRLVAKDLGLSMARLDKDLAGSELKSKVDADLAEADKFDINGVPAFIINGKLYEGTLSVSEFSKIIDDILN
ncbi:MAG: thioredoxin domain-containing protein [Bacillota bacterium]|nr:thioredoxin domain-containing protein [Bacillota bacterium]